MLADSEEEAYAARRLVKVTYTKIKAPIVCIDDAIKAGQVSEKAMEDITKGDVNQSKSSSLIITEIKSNVLITARRAHAF